MISLRVLALSYLYCINNLGQYLAVVADDLRKTAVVPGDLEDDLALGAVVPADIFDCVVG